MKTKIHFLSVMTLLLLIPQLGSAQDGYGLKNKPKNEKPVLKIEENNGLTVRFLGEEEEGALKLFIKNTTSNYDLRDPTADALNEISPAAGIQFKFEF